MKNVVMVSVDDLFNVVRFRDAYGVSIETPNIDRLLDRSVYFDSAHAIKPACNPSRASTMTGLSHYKVGVNENSDKFFDIVNPEDTIGYAFKEAGYTTIGNGKLFHGGIEEGFNANGKAEFLEAVFDEYVPSVGDITGGGNHTTVGNNTGPSDIPEEDHADTNAAEWAADYVRDNVDAQDPYFLAVGLHKPHLLWNVPQKYYDMYDPDDIVTPVTPIDDYDDVPLFFQHVLTNLFNIHDAVLEADEWVEAIHGYLAAISYVDAQIGKIVDAFDETDAWETSTIILWSDHGYHLGDKETWGKFTHWENATNAPVIISDPDIVAEGVTVTTPVSLMDIFPTLVDLAGIDDPGPTRDGQSLVPILENPDDEIEGVAVSVFDGSISLRDNSYRYIVSITGEEQLYDMVNDPQQWDNLAVSASGDPEVISLLQSFQGLAASEATRLGLKTDFLADTLTGTNESEWLMVSANVVQAVGGAGDDTYDVYRASDLSKILEHNNNGTDKVRFISSQNIQQVITLSENVEDLLWLGSLGNLVLTATDAENSIYASGRADVLNLLGGDDFASGEVGRDTIFGGSGNDTVLGGAGNDELDGGAGEDRLQGGDNDDLIFGGHQRDTIIAGDGDDIVWSGAGRDYVELGAGDDVYTDGDQSNSNGRDSVFGGDGNDTLNGISGHDSLNGGWNQDLIFGGGGRDTIIGGLGKDTIHGEGGNDWIEAGGQNDVVYGGNGKDTIYGGAHDDTLFGEGGADVLNGLADNDELWGGNGADIFEFGADWGHDTIKDFSLGQDTIHWLGGSNIREFSALSLAAESEGVLITDAEHIEQSIFLEGIGLDAVLLNVEGIFVFD